MARPDRAVSTEEFAAAVGAEAGGELQKALGKIKHCLKQLTDGQLWWRADESQNSIGNLILHLCGNVRQWIISGLGGARDVRDRPAEFSERRPIPASELLNRVERVVAEAMAVLRAVPAGGLLRVRRVQGFDVTGLQVIFDSIPHFRGHTQEIIYRTRLLLGDKYEFAWKPLTPEQGGKDLCKPILP